MSQPFALVALAAALVLAGCFSGPGNDSPSGGTPTPAADRVLLANSLGLVDPATIANDPLLAALLDLSVAWRSVAGMDAREPTVAVDSTGAIYYAARDYSGGNTPPVSATQTPLMKSTDGGLTWEDVSPRMVTDDREPPRSGDPMVVIDPWTDRIFQIELYDLVCNWLVYSDDGGDSWMSNPKACSSVVVDHQTIGAGPPALATTVPVGYPNVVYVCVNQIANSHCSRSLTGGVTFESYHIVYPPVSPAEGGCNLPGGIHGHVLVGPDGTVYLPRQYCDRAYAGISRDDGLTWDLVDVAPSMGASDQDPNMAFDKAGNVYYFWIGTDEIPYLVWSSDSGRSWSEPVRVAPPHVTAANLPAIAAGDDGRIGVMYMATDDTETPPAEGTDWDNVTFDAYITVSLDATATDPTFATVRANPVGDALYRGDCTHQRCGFVREFGDATLAPDGSFYAAFVDACLRPDEPRAKDARDCNTLAADFGEGNGHLGYVIRMEGVSLLSTPVASMMAPARDGPTASGLAGL